MIKNISNSHPNVFIENKQIKQVYECKTPGVKIDQHFTSKGNTDEICKKVAVGIFDIRWIKPFVDQDTPIKIYSTIVRPYFDYCSKVWDVFGEAQWKRLQKLQNRAARIILNVNDDVEPTIALRALGWEPLQMERKKAKAKIMYKLSNQMGPKSLTNLFSYKSKKTNYHLRDISSGLCLPKPRTNNMKNSFMYDGAQLWNSIPKETRESKSLSSFWNKIAAHKIAA